MLSESFTDTEHVLSHVFELYDEVSLKHCKHHNYPFGAIFKELLSHHWHRGQNHL